MSNEKKQKFSVLNILCLAIGIITGIVLVQNVFGLGGMIGGALGGGLGAVLGMGIYFVVTKFTGKT